MPEAAARPGAGPADAMSGYKVTVTRTLNLAGRYRGRESGKAFALDLIASGQVAPGDWETTVTAEPLETSSGESPCPRRKLTTPPEAPAGSRAETSGPVKVPIRQRILLYQPGEEFIPRWLFRRWTARVDYATPAGSGTGFCGHATFTKRGMQHWMTGYEAAARTLSRQAG